MTRRHRTAFFTVACAVAAFSASAAAQDLQPDRPTYVPGEYLVKLRPSQSVEQLGANFTMANQEGEVVKKFLNINSMLIRLPDEIEAGEFQRIRANASRSPVIERIEPNYIIYQDQVTPNDPELDEMWFLETIEAQQAWQIQHESPEIVVAVIDTGVFMGHEDLQGNIWVNETERDGVSGQDDDGNGYEDDLHGYDFYNDDGDPAADAVPVDVFPPFCIPHDTQKEYEAHGTHVAGTIGAVGNNGKGIAGVTWKVKIMPLKFLGGTCGSGTTADAIEAVDYAVANGARIINASWGGGPYSQFLKDAVDAADSAGVLFVAAAGNSGEDNELHPHYPSSYDSPNIVAVAATDQGDNLAGFSCFGHDSVDLAAPGVEILSAVPTGDETTPTPGSGYAAFQGTSMATPIVSGVAALVMARYPSLTHLEVKQVLLQSVDEVPALQGMCVTGGRLNLASAVGSADSPQELAQRLGIAQPPENLKVTPELGIKLLLRPPFEVNPARKSSAAGHRDDAGGGAAVEQPKGFLVTFGEGVTAEQVTEELRPEGLKIEKVVSKTRGVYLISGENAEEGADAEDVLKQKRQEGVIKSFEPNFIIRKDE